MVNWTHQPPTTYLSHTIETSRKIDFEITGGGTVSEEEEEDEQDPQWTRYRRQRAAATARGGGAAGRSKRAAWAATVQRWITRVSSECRQVHRGTDCFFSVAAARLWVLISRVGNFLFGRIHGGGEVVKSKANVGG